MFLRISFPAYLRWARWLPKFQSPQRGQIFFGMAGLPRGEMGWVQPKDPNVLDRHQLLYVVGVWCIDPYLSILHQVLTKLWWHLCWYLLMIGPVYSSFHSHAVPCKVETWSTTQKDVFVSVLSLLVLVSDYTLTLHDLCFDNEAGGIKTLDVAFTRIWLNIWYP